MRFLMFVHDDFAVNLDDVTGVRALGEVDRDVRTGEWKSSIPKAALTVVWMRNGHHFYTKQPYPEVMDTLRLVAKTWEGQ